MFSRVSLEVCSHLSLIFLHISVPPEKPKIFDVRGQEVQLKLGPFRVGDSALIKCETWGGKLGLRLFYISWQCLYWSSSYTINNDDTLTQHKMGKNKNFVTFRGSFRGEFCLSGFSTSCFCYLWVGKDADFLED